MKLDEIIKSVPGPVTGKKKEDFLLLKKQETIILTEAKHKIREGLFTAAEEMLRSILPDDNIMRDDETIIYRTFNEPMEELLFEFTFKPGRSIRSDVRVNLEAYLTYAFLLIEQGQLDEALKILERGLIHNPVDVRLLFEEGEIFKLRKDWETFRNITDQCFNCCFRAADVARAYRNYGYMFIENEQFDPAICCYLLSLQYDKHAIAQKQLFYISKTTGSYVDTDHYHERLEDILSGQGIPLCPSEDVLGLAYSLGDRFARDDNNEAALYFLGIFYELTGDEETGTKIADIVQRSRS